MVYKVSGFNKFTYKDKKTGADRQACVLYGLRHPNSFESRSTGLVGLIAENRFIGEEQLKLIPKGGFELGKCYEFKFESDDGHNVILSSISLTDDF